MNQMSILELSIEEIELVAQFRNSVTYICKIENIIKGDISENIGDKTTTYNILKNSKLWDLYIEHYDVTHTLGAEYILNEMREYFIDNGVEFSY